MREIYEHKQKRFVPKEAQQKTINGRFNSTEFAVKLILYFWKRFSIIILYNDFGY